MLPSAIVPTSDRAKRFLPFLNLSEVYATFGIQPLGFVLYTTVSLL